MDAIAIIPFINALFPLSSSPQRNKLLRHRRMDAEGAVEVGLGGAHLHRHGEALDDLAGVIAEHNQELADTLNARTFALAQREIANGADLMMNICSTCQGAQSECQQRLDAEQLAAVQAMGCDATPGSSSNVNADAAGHEVEEAPNGNAAIERLHNGYFDVVVSDWRLPDGRTAIFCGETIHSPGRVPRLAAHRPASRSCARD